MILINIYHSVEEFPANMISATSAAILNITMPDSVTHLKSFEQGDDVPALGHHADDIEPFLPSQSQDVISSCVSENIST